MRVIWSPSALRQVERIFEYLVVFNPRAAEKVVAILIETGDGLATFPNRGRLVRGSDKREVMMVYPYIIRYRVSGETVRILRVRHSARRPTK